MQNILIVMADQLSALALGCYRNPVVKSPQIDRLADEGVVFDAAYSSSPLCTPARYAFMTGQNIQILAEIFHGRMFHSGRHNVTFFRKGL